MEDLPGLTGTGLSLSVYNFLGFKDTLAAIMHVWAPAFLEHAYKRRQAYMENPEHVYASVLLMRSVPVEKFGVVITVDVETSSPEMLTVGVNESDGCAVSGPPAEELRIKIQNGEVHLMSPCKTKMQRVSRACGALDICQKTRETGEQMAELENRSSQVVPSLPG